jgi:hypothetical protein
MKVMLSKYFFLGWASELQVLVQINSLREQHRPKIDDPDFWAVWSR